MAGEAAVVADPAPEIVIVSVTSTTGWGNAARQLAASLTAAGARVGIAETGPVPEVRTFMATDFVQALAARRTAAAALAAHRPRALIYCSITAALLWPAPGAIWLDAIAAENRPGRHGIWQRRLELRRLAAAPLVMTMAADSLAPIDPLTARRRWSCRSRSTAPARRSRGRSGTSTCWRIPATR